MDDVLILFSKIIIDIQGFNESHFGIFLDSEKDQLKNVWNLSNKNPNQFIGHLSPNQKEILTKWAIHRSTFSTKELIKTLELFIKYLKKLNSNVYPKQQMQEEKKTSFFKKIIYKN